MKTNCTSKLSVSFVYFTLQKEARVHSLVNPCGIRGRPSGKEKTFSAYFGSSTLLHSFTTDAV